MTAMRRIAIWMVAILLSATWAYVMFTVITDAPTWFTVAAGVWMFDRLDSKVNGEVK